MFGVVTGGDSNRGEYIGKSTFEWGRKLTGEWKAWEHNKSLFQKKEKPLEEIFISIDV
jgi:hypothetical protein